MIAYGVEPKAGPGLLCLESKAIPTFLNRYWAPKPRIIYYSAQGACLWRQPARLGPVRVALVWRLQTKPVNLLKATSFKYRGNQNQQSLSLLEIKKIIDRNLLIIN